MRLAPLHLRRGCDDACESLKPETAAYNNWNKRCGKQVPSAGVHSVNTNVFCQRCRRCPNQIHRAPARLCRHQMVQGLPQTPPSSFGGEARQASTSAFFVFVFGRGRAVTCPCRGTRPCRPCRAGWAARQAHRAVTRPCRPCRLGWAAGQARRAARRRHRQRTRACPAAPPPAALRRAGWRAAPLARAARPRRRRSLPAVGASHGPFPEASSCVWDLHV
mmetsp:Transcript_7305/g.22239  ORF Transcript_7305/g.22239 Transcript_7305/m.22239 type:complete len:219 (+) Transcript_7305:263-919(+)